MSQVTETICDQCGARKNGNTPQREWWRALITNEGFHLYTAKADPTDDNLKDFCSEDCVERELTNFFTKIRDRRAADHYREVGMNNG